MCLVRLRWKRQRDGPQRGLEEIRTIADSYRLTKYPFRHAALGEFELRRGKKEAAPYQPYGAALSRTAD